MEDLRVVRKGQAVGEARRTAHALVAQVELGSQGTFALTLQPTLCDGQVERRLQFGVELGQLLVGLVEAIGKGDALFQFRPGTLHRSIRIYRRHAHTHTHPHAHTLHTISEFPQCILASVRA